MMTTKNLRRLMSRCQEICQKLENLCAGDAEARKLLVQLRRWLIVLDVETSHWKVGRPKGKRHKVTADQIEAIRRWDEGDRSQFTSDSVTGLAKALGLSRQTVHTILGEIRQSAPDEQKPGEG